MELVSGNVLIIGIIAVIIIMCIKIKKRKMLTESTKKIANVEYIKSTQYYKALLRRYKIYKIAIYSFCIVSIIVSLVLISRPVKIEKDIKTERKRDIFLCMDISGSMSSINLDVVTSMKKIVNELKEERFGIVIFNSSPLELVPLTDDYKYVLDMLDQLEKYFKSAEDMASSYDLSATRTWTSLDKILASGTLARDGSSIITDSLASCVYCFPDLGEERSRYIILSTDFEQYGNPILTMKEAADICIERGIRVYGIMPEFSLGDEITFKNGVRRTGGETYTINKKTTVTDVIEKINSEEKALSKPKETIRYIDQPKIPFIILFISVFCLFILDKKVEMP